MKYENIKYMLVSMVILVFIATISFTYAYFVVTRNMEEDPNDQIVTTGTLSITYTDGPEIMLDNAYPGSFVGKEILIENTGSLSTSYNIKWKNLFNNSLNDEIRIDMRCREYLVYNGYGWYDNIEGEGNVFISECGELYEPVGNSINSSLFQQVNINPESIHVYYVGIHFVETNEDQNYNQGKLFTGELEVVGGKDEISIYGQLQDINGDIISNATLSFTSSSGVISAVTNQYGYYYIKGLDPGENNLSIVDENSQLLATDTITLSKSITSSITNKEIFINLGEKYYYLESTLGSSNDVQSYKWKVQYTSESCFTFSNGEISGYNSMCPKAVAIPEIIDESTVTTIKSNAFSHMGLTNLYIPDTVINIEANAFKFNRLMYVEYLNNLEGKNVSNYAFVSNPGCDSENLMYFCYDD